MDEPPLTGAPHAPYPPAPAPHRNRPMMSAAGSGRGMDFKLSAHLEELQQQRQQQQRPFLASGMDASNRTSVPGRQSRQRLIPRVAFVPGALCSDLYGAVNCFPVDAAIHNGSNHADALTGREPVTSSSPFTGGAAGAGSGGNSGGKEKSGVASRIKYGPPLLEIRRMKCSLYVPNGVGATCPREEESEERKNQIGDDSDSIKDKGTATRESRIFRHETILVSRGIPGLGGNVSSTCLDFCLSTEGQQRSGGLTEKVVRCATGQTSGALCIHSITNLIGGGSDPPSSTVSHYAPRQQRPATSVAWRPGNSALVAVGLVGGGGENFAGGGGGMGGMGVMGPSAAASPLPSFGSAAGVASIPGGAAGVIGLGAGAAAGGDRDFGILIWDIEVQAGGGTKISPSVGKAGAAAITIKTPAYRFGHNAGVESLSWLSEGQTLAAGCQKRNVQLYDLRMSGLGSPPISVFAHTEAVAGVVPEPSCPSGTVFATFGRNPGEPVKIWDSRMMDATLGEIGPQYSGVRGSGSCVSAVAWSMARPGVISVAVGDSVRNYDTRGPGSRALPVGVSYLDADKGGDGDISIQCLAFQPQLFSGHGMCSTPLPYPHRTLAVSSKGQISVIPEFHAAPLALSKRDGRIASGVGSTVWIRPSTDAIEGQSIVMEDISARIMRRAKSFHGSQYSTNAGDNVRVLEEEREQILSQEHSQLRCAKHKRRPLSSKLFNEVFIEIDQLLHCWRWIALVEHLSIDSRGPGDEGVLHSDDIISWPAKGLIDAGTMKLIRPPHSSRDGVDESNNWMDTKRTSDTLQCDVFYSPLRRAALNACGWIKQYGQLQDLLDECEGRGEFERAAALALWHGDIEACVSALQRGAEDVKTLVEEECDSPSTNIESYSETLGLIAMCVAGFNVVVESDGTRKTNKIWSNACINLLHRSDITMTANSSQVPQSYLRAILLFLQILSNPNIESGYSKIINNEGLSLSLSDRVGFACRFLPRADLLSFLDTSMRKCIKEGDLEGLLITGLDKRGVGLLQSYVDRTSDVQTAALMSCRVVLPTEWWGERRLCSEWLESYRLLLNGFQMWHSRAAFDVGRFEHLRRLKQGGVGQFTPSGRHASVKKQYQKDKFNSNNFPPQLWARCNYCNAPLPLSKLRRQEGIANSWLSRQKPVLTCCPQCKKPLPRCSICLLSLGCLNPYMELQRERNQYPRSCMPVPGTGGGGMEDLSGLASMPFATWWAWCMRCKHGGHAHHLCGWFEKHSTCPVSGCDCSCMHTGFTLA